MRILALNPGHDGAIVFIKDGQLRFSLEGEKDAHSRYSPINTANLLDAFSKVDEPVDVVAVGGWFKGPWITGPNYLAGYFGLAPGQTSRLRILGSQATLFSSSHERSHLLCSYGLSPYEHGTFCYALVWEGHLGSFYQIDERMRIKRLAQILPGVGDKYLYFYNIGRQQDGIDFSAAGKLMALASFSQRESPTRDESDLIDFVLDEARLMKTPIEAAKWSSLYRIGVEHARFKNAAGLISDRIFDRFLRDIEPLVRRRAPLLISGGCGLNCDWNTQWKRTGLFSDVFVPPCANDSGSAIGTAIDAQLKLTGQAKIRWNVYAGSEFDQNLSQFPGFQRIPGTPSQIAELLSNNLVLGWVEGRYEIGPRALGHRSIVASPFPSSNRDRLNQVKQREGYRPIAPICCEQKVSRYFDWEGPSPYMLYFQKVTDPELHAITHVDGTARVQTIPKGQSLLASVLEEFERITGVAVLCNTSLNGRGTGFINNSADLHRFAVDRGLDGFVIDGELFLSNEVYTAIDMLPERSILRMSDRVAAHR